VKFRKENLLKLKLSKKRQSNNAHSNHKSQNQPRKNPSITKKMMIMFLCQRDLCMKLI